MSRRLGSAFLFLSLSLISACADRDPEDAADAAVEKTAGALNAATAAQLARGEPGRDFVPGELIVQLDRKLTPGKGIELGGQQLTPIEELPSGAWRMVLTSAGTTAFNLAAQRGQHIADAELAAAERSTLDALTAIEAQAGVQRAHLNGLVEYSYVPSDPFYFYQRWNYEAIKLPDAWDWSFGTYNVRLAIIDSESEQNQHPDLAGRWSNGADFAPEHLDYYHHGAHVAGIAGAAMDNGYGVGVCPGCQLMPYHITPSYAHIEQAIAYAAGNGGPIRADVINMSFNQRAISYFNQARLTCNHSSVSGVKLAIADAVARGVVVVVSAGNYFATNGETGAIFPADCPGVIAVAATQPGGTLAAYSNRGGNASYPAVTLAAPGGGGNGATGSNSQYGSWLDEMQCPPPYSVPDRPNDAYAGTAGVVAPWTSYTPNPGPDDYCYRYLSGTSMSAPHVAGTVGLMKSRNDGLSLAQVKDILVRTAQTNTPCPVGLCGAGLLNAHAAVYYAFNGGVPLATLAPVAFGNVTTGAPVVANAQVASTGSAWLTVGGSTFTISGGSGQIQFAYSSGACTSGTTCSRTANIAPEGGLLQIPLRCNPTAAGSITATLTISTNRFDSATGGLDVPLTTTLTCNGLAQPPDVTVNPTSLDFGSAIIGTASAARTFTVRNSGGGTLPFTASEASADYALTCVSACTCSGGSCTGSLIATQTATLSAIFTPTATGTRAATITVATPADPDEPSTSVSLTGVGLPIPPDVTITPTSINFGSVIVGNISTIQSFTVRNSGGGTLPFTASESSADFSLACVSGCTCTAGSCTGSLTANQAVTISAVFTPQATGARSTNVTVATPADPDEPSTLVSFTGVGLPLPPDVTITPTSINLGSINVGTSSAAQSFTVRNIGGGTLPFTASESSADFSLACVSGCTCTAGSCTGSLAANQTATLNALFAPTATGPRSAAVAIATPADPDEPTTTVALSGVGTQPSISVTPSPLEIGSVLVGASRTGTGSIRNTGTGTLRVTQLALTGPAGVFSFDGPCAGQTSCSTTIDIAPAASSAISIRCSPNAHALLTAQLVITSNTAPGSPASYLVRCQGLAPVIVVSPPSIAFGELAVGSSATRALSISNTSAGLGTSLAWSTPRLQPPFALSCTSAAPQCTCTATACSGGSPSSGSALEVRFTPTANGSTLGSLVISSNDPARPTVTVPVSGNGHLSLTRLPSSTLPFVVPSGESVTLQVQNQGATAVTIQSMSISQRLPPSGLPVFSFTGPASGQLAPGAIGSWTLTCTSPYFYAGSLNLHHDGPVSPLTVPLNCIPVLDGPGDPPPEEM